MKSQETDIRDHETAADAMRAEVERSRAANADKQAAEMARVLGKRRSSPLTRGAPGSTVRRIEDALTDE
jgi:hypothetical protein